MEWWRSPGVTVPYHTSLQCGGFGFHFGKGGWVTQRDGCQWQMVATASPAECQAWVVSGLQYPRNPNRSVVGAFDCILSMSALFACPALALFEVFIFLLPSLDSDVRPALNPSPNLGSAVRPFGIGISVLSILYTCLPAVDVRCFGMSFLPTITPSLGRDVSLLSIRYIPAWFAMSALFRNSVL